MSTKGDRPLLALLIIWRITYEQLYAFHASARCFLVE